MGFTLSHVVGEVSVSLQLLLSLLLQGPNISSENTSLNISAFSKKVLSDTKQFKSIICGNSTLKMNDIH